MTTTNDTAIHDFAEPHMLTVEAFASAAIAVALINHGRRWDVRYGDRFSAFSDEATPDAAIADVHKAMVNNALYLNLYPIGDDKPDMPPSEVLAQYPDFVARFPELALTPNAQVGLGF